MSVNDIVTSQARQQLRVREFEEVCLQAREENG